MQDLYSAECLICRSTTIVGHTGPAHCFNCGASLESQRQREMQHAFRCEQARNQTKPFTLGAM